MEQDATSCDATCTRLQALAHKPEADLLAQVDDLMRRHVVETRACIERWANTAQGLVMPACEPPELITDTSNLDISALRQTSDELQAVRPYEIPPRISEYSLPELPEAYTSEVDSLPGALPLKLDTLEEEAEKLEWSPHSQWQQKAVEAKAWDKASDTSGVGMSRALTAATRGKGHGGDAVKNVLSDGASAEKLKKAVGNLEEKKGRSVTSALFKDTRRSAIAHLSMLQRITNSRYYEWVSACLIVSNSVWIGYQTENLAFRARDNARHDRPQEAGMPPEFKAVNVTFDILFTIDLVMRWSAEGLINFFCTRDSYWNAFDTVVVASALLDLTLEVIPGNLSYLRVLRVVRIVRLARVIRVMRFFRELRMMVYSILGSMKSLAWVCVVLGMMFYLFGVNFTSATVDYLRTSDMWDEHTDLVDSFGSLEHSVMSLFMAMSGGRDWGVYYSVIEKLGTVNKVLYLIFILVSIFAVVNVVTGIFVETAMEANRKDCELIVTEELEYKQQYLNSMARVFHEMDVDGTGNISIDEFEKRLDDERVVAYFNSIKLDVSDARVLFELMDYDMSNEVSIDEFVIGCYRLQGESRSLDVKLMQAEMRFVKELLVNLIYDLEERNGYDSNDGEPRIRTSTCEERRKSRRQSTRRSMARGSLAPPSLFEMQRAGIDFHRFDPKSSETIVE